jgi:hypothetical protein
LNELLSELRVTLPGSQVLLGFLLTIPFASRFELANTTQRWTYFVSLWATFVGTVLLMAPAVYHRVRWRRGGKSDAIAIAHRLFLVGTGCLGFGLSAALFFVAGTVFEPIVAVSVAVLTSLLLIGTWYVLPLTRSYRDDVAEAE